MQRIKLNLGRYTNEGGISNISFTFNSEDGELRLLKARTVRNEFTVGRDCNSPSDYLNIMCLNKPLQIGTDDSLNIKYIIGSGGYIEYSYDEYGYILSALNRAIDGSYQNTAYDFYDDRVIVTTISQSKEKSEKQVLHYIVDDHYMITDIKMEDGDDLVSCKNRFFIKEGVYYFNPNTGGPMIFDRPIVFDSDSNLPMEFHRHRINFPTNFSLNYDDITSDISITYINGLKKFSVKYNYKSFEKSDCAEYELVFSEVNNKAYECNIIKNGNRKLIIHKFSKKYLGFKPNGKTDLFAFMNNILYWSDIAVDIATRCHGCVDVPVTVVEENYDHSIIRFDPTDMNINKYITTVMDRIRIDKEEAKKQDEIQRAKEFEFHKKLVNKSRATERKAFIEHLNRIDQKVKQREKEKEEQKERKRVSNAIRMRKKNDLKIKFEEDIKLREETKEKRIGELFEIYSKSLSAHPKKILDKARQDIEQEDAIASLCYWPKFDIEPPAATEGVPSYYRAIRFLSNNQHPTKADFLNCIADDDLRSTLIRKLKLNNDISTTLYRDIIIKELENDHYLNTRGASAIAYYLIEEFNATKEDAYIVICRYYYKFFDSLKVRALTKDIVPKKKKVKRTTYHFINPLFPNEVWVKTDRDIVKNDVAGDFTCVIDDEDVFGDDPDWNLDLLEEEEYFDNLTPTEYACRPDGDDEKFGKALGYISYISDFEADLKLKMDKEDYDYD